MISHATISKVRQTLADEVAREGTVTGQTVREVLNSVIGDLLREAILTVEVDGRIVVVRTPTETQNVIERDVWNQLGDEIRDAGGVTLLVTTRDYDLTTLTLDDIPATRR